MVKHRVRLVAVATIILVLAAIVMFRYQTNIRGSREEVLRGNLVALRNAIDQYTTDKQDAPQSLQQLVDSGYFRQMPIDPMTNSNSSWKPVIGNVVLTSGKTVRGITDLQSGSGSIASDGTIYSAW